MRVVSGPVYADSDATQLVCNVDVRTDTYSGPNRYILGKLYAAQYDAIEATSIHDAYAPPARFIPAEVA
jgi:hypothetical protein